jgi:hypothetical protein
MDKGEYATIAETQVRKFNGKFFKHAAVLDLMQEEIGELLAAAKADWKEVDPAIFGTLLEQALDPKERSRLGAHYTPRAYVERLVVVTVIEPLRQEWAEVQAAAERLQLDAQRLSEEAAEAGDQSKRRKDDSSVAGEKLAEARRKHGDALTILRAFHTKICATRVLDPACGTGNFLYVALKLLKALEDDVKEALNSIAGPQDSLDWMDKQEVDPHQFLGLEKNSRAAAIAELVVWLGHLQLHYASENKHPPEPILKDFHNITCMDAVLTWDGYPVPGTAVGKDGKRVEAYPNARRPDWPEAEFIVGNPPFIGGKDVRAELGSAYVEALWKTHQEINDSADFVMYWWDRAAVELRRAETPLRRFGLVTTNSITQVFSRRTIARHLEAENPLSLLMAIPDHPWTKVTKDHAAVRIAMTVAAAGEHDGVLREVTSEAALDTDDPQIEFSIRTGRVNADLTVGADVTQTLALDANRGLSSPGVKLHGDGFIVTPDEAAHLGLGKRPGLEHHIRPYRNGRDLASLPRGVMVIDLFGLDADDVRKRFPEVYQHLLETVKVDRERQHAKSPTRDAKEYLDRWWTHGKPRSELRPALAHLPRYIATVETAKQRTFQFLDGAILPDNMLVAIGSDDAVHLGVLSSRAHVAWAMRAGGWLGVGNDPRYSKSRCFDPFPFPLPSEPLKVRIRAVAEELDAHRKSRQAEHPGLTLTRMYNVLEKLKTPSPPSSGGEGRGEGQQHAPGTPATGGESEATGNKPGAASNANSMPAAPGTVPVAAPHPNPLPAKSGERGQVDLTPDDERIKTDGLVLILKELHEKLDALVLEAYGWTDQPNDELILERLVALNAERAAQEATGHVAWLRPDYQIPRFGSEAEQARLKAEKQRLAAEAKLRPKQGALDLDDDLREMLPSGDPKKPSYPTGQALPETIAVLKVLAEAKVPVSIPDIARAFRQGLKVEHLVRPTVHALARLGHVRVDGDRFALSGGQ